MSNTPSESPAESSASQASAESLTPEAKAPAAAEEETSTLDRKSASARQADSTTDSRSEGEQPAVDYSQVRIRRAPSVVAFMILGLVLGLAAALVSVIFGPSDPTYSETSVFGIIAVIYGALGVALGALLGLWLDRRSVKKSVIAQVEPESESGADKAQ